MTESSLTTRQSALLAFMLAFHAQHHMWPTVREICDECGFSSQNAVYEQLQALKKRGLVRHRKNSARGWVAIQEGAT